MLKLAQRVKALEATRARTSPHLRRQVESSAMARLETSDLELLIIVFTDMEQRKSRYLTESELGADKGRRGRLRANY